MYISRRAAATTLHSNHAEPTGRSLALRGEGGLVCMTWGLSMWFMLYFRIHTNTRTL